MAMTQAQVSSLIERVTLFHGLDHEDVEKIFARGMTMRVRKGEVVFHKGTVGGQMYVVLSGVLGVFDGDKCLAQLKLGEMFGEMALVTQQPRSATVAALEDADLFVLSQSTFERLMTKRAAIRILLNMVASLSRRLRDANARLAN